MYEPELMNGEFGPKEPGKGLPPETLDQGSAKFSGPFGVTVLPKGGAVVGVDMIIRFGKSYDMPNAARITVLPSPFGSNATPRRGANWSYRRSTPAMSLKPGSPAYRRPAGAFLKTVL